MLYTIVFKDKSVFVGGDYQNTKWQEIPDKPIGSLFYTLPSGDCLGINKFDRIYHLPEVTYDLMGEEKGKVKLEMAHIFVDRKGVITHYIILLNKKLMGKIKKIIADVGKINNFDRFLGEDKDYIIKEVLNINDKQIKELNPIGWKNGR